MAEDVGVEGRDWNAKKPLPTEQPTEAGKPAAPAAAAEAPESRVWHHGCCVYRRRHHDMSQPAPAAANGGPQVDHTRFAKASDKGLQAWAPATKASGTEKALRQIRGIINKLTPEKFDRLLGQLVGLVTSLDILQGTIRLLFESATAQPTFVTVYAELCHRLSTVRVD